MWESILRFQHLYSTDPLVIAKYIGEAPRTSYFPEKAPGKAAVWTGYQIVETYMNKHQESTDSGLIENKSTGYPYRLPLSSINRLKSLINQA